MNKREQNNLPKGWIPARSKQELEFKKSHNIPAKAIKLEKIIYQAKFKSRGYRLFDVEKKENGNYEVKEISWKKESFKVVANSPTEAVATFLREYSRGSELEVIQAVYSYHAGSSNFYIPVHDVNSNSKEHKMKAKK